MAVVNRVPELVAAKFGGKENINLMEIERATGLTYSTVARWVKDRVDRADFPILATWCEYLQCGIGDLLVYVKDEYPQQ